jgi:hypothetical protein
MLLLFVAGALVFFFGSILLAKRIGQHRSDDVLLYALIGFGLLMSIFCICEVFMSAFRV